MDKYKLIAAQTGTRGLRAIHRNKIPLKAKGK